ncbi:MULTISPECIES: DNA topoisomerase IB [Cryobacterium]|uniref:DNA topoisomerase IB n=1 Tax=Cryobacterium TaxID=69578 RepID=UPI001F546BA3|nr:MULTISPECIES: DNA topoisomerase IB [Cryobacterium]
MTRLRRSDTTKPGFARRRAGRGFSYRDPAGGLVTDPQLRARFNALAIPPAWTDVWIAPHPNAHIQATGLDDAGRRQYLYHPAWRLKQDRVKFDRALALAETLPAARGTVTRWLRQDGESRERTLAAAFRMLDSGSLRIGSERYTDAHGSHGLSTLLSSHVQLDGDTLFLRFPAKSGQVWESSIRDPDLAAFLREGNRSPDDPVLSWSEGGERRALTATEINAFIKERTGSDFTAKDFRTLSGTVVAAVSLAAAGPADSIRERNAAVSQAMQDAADVLGNTPTIARKSYVDPRVLDYFIAGETIGTTRLASGEAALRSLLIR